MPKWVEFKEDHDHYWPSRAVTAFKKGMKVYVKNDVADPAIEQGRAAEIERPAEDDPAYVATTASEPETQTGNPESAGAPFNADQMDRGALAAITNPAAVDTLAEEVGDDPA